MADFVFAVRQFLAIGKAPKRTLVVSHWNAVSGPRIAAFRAAVTDRICNECLGSIQRTIEAFVAIQLASFQFPFDITGSRQR
jgi:hypothetical protein